LKDIEFPGETKNLKAKYHKSGYN